MPVVVFWAASILLARRPAWNSILVFLLPPLRVSFAHRGQYRIEGILYEARVRSLWPVLKESRKAPSEALRVGFGFPGREEAREKRPPQQSQRRAPDQANMGALSIVLSDPLSLPYLLKVKVGSPTSASGRFSAAPAHWLTAPTSTAGDGQEGPDAAVRREPPVLLQCAGPVFSLCQAVRLRLRQRSQACSPSCAAPRNRQSRRRRSQQRVAELLHSHPAA